MPILIPTNIYNKLRVAIYAYFFLILFDGIFRKWLLPSLSAPIMMLKQVAAIIICLIGFRYIKRMTRWEISFFFVGIIVFATTMIFGHGNLIVALYGCLPYWFGLPVCFFIGKILTEKDLNFFSKVIIYTSIANSILLIIQFMLPPSHFLNYQGGDVNLEIYDTTVSELASAYRPAGIFIHNSHNTLFMLLSFSLILYNLLFDFNKYTKTCLVSTCILDIIACICSASRTNLFLHIVFSIFIISILNKKLLYQAIKFFSVIIILLISISFTSLGKKAIININNRFESVAIEQLGQKNIINGFIIELIERTIEYNYTAMTNPQTIDGEKVPFWGYGQGISTQVGARILKVNRNSGFMFAEFDGLRIICESGLLLGWIIILIRIGYLFKNIRQLKYCKNDNYYLPIIIYPNFFISFFLLSTWGNIFIANFAFFTAGLYMVSIQHRK